eukprot:788972-Prorocentrum_minimum.AAC.1
MSHLRGVRQHLARARLPRAARPPRGEADGVSPPAPLDVRARLCLHDPTALDVHAADGAPPGEVHRVARHHLQRIRGPPRR